MLLSSVSESFQHVALRCISGRGDIWILIGAISEGIDTYVVGDSRKGGREIYAEDGVAAGGSRTSGSGSIFLVPPYLDSNWSSLMCLSSSALM